MFEKQRLIIIADRGWVYVGLVYRDGDMLVITDCYNIRKWGTSKGLGELALEGPKANTVLDYYGVVKIHILGMCSMIECDEEVWSAKTASSA